MEPSDLVQQLGPHPASLLGLDLEQAEDRSAWLLAAALLSQPGAESRILETLLRLGGQGLLEPGAACSRVAAVSSALQSGPWKDARLPLARLLGIAEALVSRGGVDAVKAQADGFEALGRALVELSSGLGPGGVLRFLRPLRSIWPDAADTPPTRHAAAAAACLGWQSPWSRPPEGPGARPGDLEAALERLGASACSRQPPAGCPLGSGCPRQGV